LHFGRRGRRGNYSERELQAWAQRLRDLREEVEVFAYFNNDWEAFAVRNALRLRRLLEAAGVEVAAPRREVVTAPRREA
jgi:uncharacterized protein YecE (DUF72 family)